MARAAGIKISAMSQPDEVRRLQDASVSLWLGVNVPVAPGTTAPADRMVIDHVREPEEDVLVALYEGKRVVLLLRQAMQLGKASPGSAVSVGWGYTTEPADPQEAERLLAIYDSLELRSFR